MLLEFSVANYMSYDERQVLSMVASNISEDLEHNIYEQQSTTGKYKILKTAAIYGANASGKSNLVHSLYTMRDVVLNSANSQRGKSLDITPFRLSVRNKDRPSEFEVIFIAHGVRYQYGFTANSKQVFDEWLFAYPKGRAQNWFHRVWDSKKHIYEWQFSSYFLGEKSVWKNSTRSNALFLSTAIQLNSEQLKPIFDWFRITLRFINPNGISPDFTTKLVNAGSKNKVLSYLKIADTNLNDLLLKEVSFDESSLPSDMPEDLRKEIIRDLSENDYFNVLTRRDDDSGNSVEFALDDESDGTQRLFAYTGPWIDVLENGRILFVDEIDNSLHTKLVRHLVSLFHNPLTNPKNAQLVFTTHDTNLLDQSFLRRDQVWFCEKDLNQSTKLFPLTDFSPRKGRENIESSYISGRYGAVPFIDN